MKALQVQAIGFGSGKLAGRCVFMRDNNIVKNALRQKADGKRYQQQEGDKFLYGRLCGQGLISSEMHLPQK